MKEPPREFIEGYDAFRERFEWAQRAVADDDLLQIQLCHADIAAFLDRWEGQTGVPELEKGLTELRPSIDQIGRLLETKYTEALRELLEKRHTVLIEPMIFRAGLAFLKIMQKAPEALRPGLEKIFREHNGYLFDAERYYRESEPSLAEYTAEYDQAFTQMELTWPDSFDTETRERLVQATIEEINLWKNDLTAQVLNSAGDGSGSFSEG